MFTITMLPFARSDFAFSEQVTRSSSASALQALRMRINSHANSQAGEKGQQTMDRQTDGQALTLEHKARSCRLSSCPWVCSACRRSGCKPQSDPPASCTQPAGSGLLYAAREGGHRLTLRHPLLQYKTNLYTPPHALYYITHPDTIPQPYTISHTLTVHHAPLYNITHFFTPSYPYI